MWSFFFFLQKNNLLLLFIGHFLDLSTWRWGLLEIKNKTNSWKNVNFSRVNEGGKNTQNLVCTKIFPGRMKMRGMKIVYCDGRGK